MKVNKKTWVILGICAAVVLALVLCFALDVFHIHSAKGAWAGNGVSHWHQCQCGELLDLGEHNLEEGFCAVCGSQVEELPDGGVRVTAYNEQGDAERIFVYGADGGQISEEQIEYTYQGGEITGKKRYQNNVLLAEYTYAKKTDGTSYVKSETIYENDGTVTVVREYDENGKLILDTQQLADGNTNAKQSEYDKESNVRIEKEYAGETLIAEYEYLQAEDGTEILIKSTVWFDDGEWVMTEHDEMGKEVSVQHFDAEGNLITE